MDRIITGVYIFSVVLFLVLFIKELYDSKQFSITFALPVTTTTTTGPCPMSCTTFPGYGCGYLSNNVMFKCPSNCCT